MDDDEYVALVEEVENVVEAVRDQMEPHIATSHDESLWNHPGLSISALLWDDLLGEVELPDATVARLWEIGYALGYDGEFLVSQDGLSRARPGRASRPPQPVLFPLKGGGHGPARGIPGKAEFPARWSDDDVTAAFMSVAQQPDGAVEQPDGTFRAWGVRDGVDLRVIVTELGHVQSAYPVTGEGVVTNPLDDLRRPYVERLQRLVDAAPFDEAARAGAVELIAAGEWDQVVLHLRAVTSGEELDALAESAGL